MLTRILTAVAGLVVFFLVIIAHPSVIYGALGIVILGMLYEMYEMLDTKRSIRPVGFVGAILFYIIALFGDVAMAFYAALSVFMLAMVALHKKADSRDVLCNAAVTLFITGFMTSLMLIRYNFDRISVVLPFVIAWLTDTGGYFAGGMFGKHKLAPKISPKKTIEGAVGGVLLAMIGGIAYAWVMNGYTTDLGSALIFAVIGIVGSIISQVGDLIASAIKRDCGKKDYGSILPGHGGILDRFDSVLFVSPFIYFALTYFGI